MTIVDKKKIAIIFPHLERGKFEEYRFQRINREKFIVNRSREEGYKCELILLTFTGEVRRRDDELGSLLFPVDNPEGVKKSEYVSTALLTWIEKEKPELVIFKGMGYKLSHWLVKKSSHRFRFAFIAAGGTREPLLPYASFGLAETDKQLQQSFAILNKTGMAEILPKLNPPNSGACPTEKEIDVINVGRFIPSKNQKSLLPLAEKYRLALIGDGPLYEEVRKEAHLRRLNVLMPGNLTRGEVQAEIAKSRLMVHSSTSEGLPRVFMEAFACGVPVVAVRDVVDGAFEHDVHGLLVEESELIRAAQGLLENRDRLNRLSRNASAYASETCNEETVWQVVNTMYTKALEDNNFPTRSLCSYFMLRIKLFIYLLHHISRKAAGRAIRLALG